jgi:hypothetical protein
MRGPLKAATMEIHVQRSLALIGTLFHVILVGCGEDQILCSPLPEQAVAVDVRDSVTNLTVISGARGAVFLGGILDDSLRRDRLFSVSRLRAGWG